MKEEWRDIPNYEGLYQASSLGRIKCLERVVSFGNTQRTVKENILNPSLSGNYLRVNLNRKTKRVHQLVAMAFLNHTPCGYKLVVDHINNNKLDNRVENLQLITNRENSSKDRTGGSSKYTGVSRSRNKWHASIKIKQKTINLGYYNCETKAHLVYQNKLQEL